MAALVVVPLVLCGLWSVVGVKGWCHQGEDPVEGDAAEEGDTVDIAVEELAGQSEECAVKDQEEKTAVEVTVVHYVG